MGSGHHWALVESGHWGSLPGIMHRYWLPLLGTPTGHQAPLGSRHRTPPGTIHPCQAPVTLVHHSTPCAPSPCASPLLHHVPVHQSSVTIPPVHYSPTCTFCPVHLPPCTVHHPPCTISPCITSPLCTIPLCIIPHVPFYPVHHFLPMQQYLVEMPCARCCLPLFPDTV